MKKLKKEWEWLKKRSRYPDVAWAELGSQDYNDAIEQINQCYRKMLQIGEADEALRKANKGVTYMLTCESRSEFRRAVKKHQREVQQAQKIEKGDAEKLPSPRGDNSRSKDVRAFSEQAQANKLGDHRKRTDPRVRALPDYI